MYIQVVSLYSLVQSYST